MSGKGSKPRNCFSKEFKKNYSKIDWTCKACSGSGWVYTISPTYMERKSRNITHTLTMQPCKCQKK